MEKEVKKEMDEAAQKAKTDKEVGLDELATDLYAKSDVPIRNVTPFSPFPHKRKGESINIK